MEQIFYILLIFIMAIILAIGIVYIISYLPRPHTNYKQQKKRNKHKPKNYE